MPDEITLCSSTSLRKETSKFSRETFPELFMAWPKVIYTYLKDRFNTTIGGLLIVPATILSFLCGQFFHPSFLEVICIPEITAHAIIDQRTANLATIFSITLVVIGWLLTHISIKESISFQMLFKHTYLYPIFYFIISLIGCMMIFSLLRHEELINMGNIVIAGTLLILFALVLIVFLFVRLIKVVDVNFYYVSLEKQVMVAVFKMARSEIMERKSLKLYKSFCEKLGFRDGIQFMTDLTQHTNININQQRENMSLSKESNPINFPVINKRVKDVNLCCISYALRNVSINNNSYYRPLHLDIGIHQNYNPFYLAGKPEINRGKLLQIKRAFKLRKPLSSVYNNRDEYLSRLHERFLKDVKESKEENIEKALAIYAKIYDLENKIIREC